MNLPSNSTLVATLGSYQIYENIGYNINSGPSIPAYYTTLFSVNQVTGITTQIGGAWGDGVSVLGTVNGYSVLNVNSGYGEYYEGSNEVLLTNGGPVETAINLSAQTNIANFATANGYLFLIATPPYTQTQTNYIYGLNGPTATPLLTAAPLLALQGATTAFAVVGNELVISNTLDGTAATNFQTNMQFWETDGTTAGTPSSPLITFNGSDVQQLGVAGAGLFVQNIFNVGLVSETSVYEINTLTHQVHELWNYANTFGIGSFPYAVAVGGPSVTVANGSTVALTGFSAFFPGAGSVTLGMSVDSVDGTVSSTVKEGTITGAGTSHMTIIGTLSQVNDVLAALQFTGTSVGQGSVVVNPTAMPSTTTIGSSGTIEIPVTAAVPPALFTEATGSVGEELSLLYPAALGRTPDAGGLAFFEKAAAQGMSLSTIAGFFTASPEFQTKYGSLTDAQFVTQLYSNLFDRAPDTSGYNYWINLLSTHADTRQDVLIGFAESKEAITDATQGYVGQSGAHAAWLHLI